VYFKPKTNPVCTQPFSYRTVADAVTPPGSATGYAHPRFGRLDPFLSIISTLLQVISLNEACPSHLSYIARCCSWLNVAIDIGSLELGKTDEMLG